MKHRKTVLLLALMAFLSSCGNSQTNHEIEPRLVGGRCEGCEAVFEYGDRNLTAIDTLPGFEEEGMPIKVTGTIYRPDGTTPAEGVILYVYHTNQDGTYATKGDEEGWGRRHGYIRGWVKTGADGKYTIYTLKPGVYPSGTEPAHIHPIILEPDGKYYWVGSYFFAGDSLLTEQQTNREEPRGGSSGVLTLHKEGNTWVGQRDFILGKKIPGYD